MKIQLVTVLEHAEGTREARPPVLLLETSASRSDATAALEAVMPILGTIVAIPPAPHEANLRLLLVKDLEARGIVGGEAEPGETLTLQVIREAHPQGAGVSAEVRALRYALD